MSARRIGATLALAALSVVAGCHHRAPTRATAPPLPPPVSAGPVMVSVPPPTHHSSDDISDVTTSNIPVVKAVRPPRKPSRRSPQPASPTAPATTIAATATASATTPVTAPPRTAAQSLGELTASTDDPAATREGAAQGIRRERDRIAAVPAATQSAHTAELEQARRFLKSAADAWTASDYAAAIALTTKTRVLLDDLSK